MRRLPFAALLLLAFLACDMGSSHNKHGMDITYTEGESYPLSYELSDVQAIIVKEEYESFVGFKVSVDGQVTVQEKKENNWLVTYDADNFSIDSIYDFDLLERPKDAVAMKITDEVSSTTMELEVGNTGDVAFIGGLEMVMEAFIEDVSTDDSLQVYYDNQFLYMQNLVKSLYTFPGKFTKGTTWQDELSVESTNYKGESQVETITLDWEVLRSNEKDVTFFGKGKSSFSSDQFDSDDEIKIDMKRQFGVNLVIDRTNFWIKRGNIDIREEKGVIYFDEESGQDMRRPDAVRNIKVKLNPIKE